MARWFTIALGIVGWTVVLGLPALDVVRAEQTSAAWMGLFILVILASRALAFRPVEGSVLSLDSAYYVAAVLCLGPVIAGRLMAIALMIDAGVRLARRDPAARGELSDELGYLIYFSGMSGAVFAGWGVVFGAAPHAGPADPFDVALRVVAIGSAALISHYALQGVRLHLLGRSWRAYLHDQAWPGLIAEASLLPIGVVLVLLYDPAHPLGFLLLSLTYLLIDLVFSRLWGTRKQLEGRVHELEILNATARRLAASLQLEELVEAVARETCKAIPAAEAVALVHRRAGGRSYESELVLDGFDRTADRFFRQAMPEGTGAAGYVMRHGVARRFDDLALADVAIANTQGIRSWLGVPLFMYGGCEGVIAVQSTRAAAFRADHQRLLESLALQIAAALQNAHLYELAMVDGLTGLFMRRYFDARIDEEIERSKRYGTPFSVIMVDVDDFKLLNDEHGHLMGDRVLRSIANAIKSQMRGVDTAARYGGEEIALILPRTEMLSAYNVGERIRAAIADLRVTTDAEPPRVLSVTASFGIASYPEIRASNGEDLVRRADRALYRAKKTGKNRVELYWSDDTGPAQAQSAPPESAS